jgi:hypothetical protein
MASQSGARLKAVVTYYKIKYSSDSERIEALKADYLAAFEASEKSGGKTLTSFDADGTRASWQIGLSADERLQALAQAIDYFQKTSRSTVILFSRTGDGKHTV